MKPVPCRRCLYHFRQGAPLSSRACALFVPLRCRSAMNAQLLQSVLFAETMSTVATPSRLAEPQDKPNAAGRDQAHVAHDHRQPSGRGSSAESTSTHTEVETHRHRKKHRTEKKAKVSEEEKENARIMHVFQAQVHPAGFASALCRRAPEWFSPGAKPPADKD